MEFGPPRLQCPTDDLFTIPVGARGVDEVDAEVERAVQKPCGFVRRGAEDFPTGRDPVIEAKLHRAK